MLLLLPSPFHALEHCGVLWNKQKSTGNVDFKEVSSAIQAYFSSCSHFILAMVEGREILQGTVLLEQRGMH